MALRGGAGRRPTPPCNNATSCVCVLRSYGVVAAYGALDTMDKGAKAYVNATAAAAPPAPPAPAAPPPLAGLVAGACSMAMGEWLSVNSARELAQRQIDQESAELAQAPELEKEELVLIYQAKGLDEIQAQSLADKIFTNHGAALDTLVREELGLDPEELGGSAWAAAASSFGLFTVGAIFPVVAFSFTSGDLAIGIGIALSGIALMAIGGATSLFTGRGFLFSAGRQLAIGYAAAAITFGVGRLIGVTIS